MVILSYGFVPGEPGNYKNFLLLASVVGMIIVPVATGLTMKLVWDTMVRPLLQLFVGCASYVQPI